MGVLSSKINSHRGLLKMGTGLTQGGRAGDCRSPSAAGHSAGQGAGRKCLSLQRAGSCGLDRSDPALVAHTGMRRWGPGWVWPYCCSSFILLRALPARNHSIWVSLKVWFRRMVSWVPLGCLMMHLRGCKVADRCGWALLGAPRGLHHCAPTCTPCPPRGGEEGK